MMSRSDEGFASMTDTAGLVHRIDVVEKGYEYLLAYAAQGRQDDAGSEVRRTLIDMRAALDGLDALIATAINASEIAARDASGFVVAAGEDARKAAGAIGLVLSRSSISSLLIDNLNASIHVRALLTDLFLIEQALKSPAAS